MKRILIVEDDKFVANICRTRLDREGFQTELAHDGQTAAEMLQERPPDLVLLDLVLPGIDGVGLLRLIRSQPALRHLPVIVFSNSTYFSGLAQSAWEAGATTFLNKADSGPDKLVESIRRLLADAAPPALQVPPTPEAPPTPPAPATPPASSPALPQAAAAPASGPLKVLAADDDKIIHGVLGFFMEQAGFTPRFAFNGQRALEMAEAEPPDVLVLDWNMPELSGINLLRIWTRNPRLAKIPVIMLTSEKDGESDALDSGAAEYLTKPFSPDRLMDLIRQHGKRYRGQLQTMP